LDFIVQDERFAGSQQWLCCDEWIKQAAVRYRTFELLNRPPVFNLDRLEFGHVEQINVDCLNFILNPEILSYLNTEEFFDISNDNIEILKNIIEYLLREEPAFIDYDMHLQSFKRALELSSS